MCRQERDPPFIDPLPLVITIHARAGDVADPAGGTGHVQQLGPARKEHLRATSRC